MKKEFKTMYIGETPPPCNHDYKETFCGDGCKEHKGVWKVCLKCNDKRRVI